MKRNRVPFFLILALLAWSFTLQSIGYHDHNRVGLEMPWCRQAIEKIRHQAGVTLPLSTLMYAEQPRGLVQGR